MKRPFLYLTLCYCFYLSALGQEKTSHTATDLNPNITQELSKPFYKPTYRIRQQNLKTKNLYKEKLDSIIEYNYNETTGTWNQKYRKETYIYDKELNEVLWLYSSWNATDRNWTNLLKEESEYNESENSVVNTQFIWSNNQWNKDRKREFTYNQNNKLIQELSYKRKYDTHDWLLTEKWEYNYNAKEQPLTAILYKWHASSKEWKSQEKIGYQYINNKELHYVFYSNWDYETKQWIEHTYEWYLYDLQWRLITLSHFEWENTSEDHWKLTNRKGYSYDDNDYLKKHVDVVFTPHEDGSIQHVIRYEAYKFDYSLVFDDLLLPNYLNKQELKFHHKLLNTNLSQYNNDTKQQEQYRNIEFYYSQTSDNLYFSSKNTPIYPNPAKESIQINYPDELSQALFELYDINGKKIISLTTNKDESIHINTLANGIYVYRIQFDSYEKTGKLIKE